MKHDEDPQRRDRCPLGIDCTRRNGRPDRLGDAESQIGAAQYFLGNFNGAIDSYVAARGHGADESMMDDNIWEACEALVKKGEKAAAQRYLELCPKGSYVKKAQKALG